MSGCATLKPGDIHNTATAHQSAPTVTTVTALYYQDSLVRSCLRQNIITDHK